MTCQSLFLGMGRVCVRVFYFFYFFLFSFLGVGGGGCGVQGNKKAHKKRKIFFHLSSAEL